MTPTTPQKARELVERLRNAVGGELCKAALEAADMIEALLATPQDQAGETVTAEPADEPVQKMHELPAVDDVERVDKLIALAWEWGHDCDVDDIHKRETVGDSHNESQREDVDKAALALKQAIVGAAQALEAMTASRDRTRAALEKMRAERDALHPTDDLRRTREADCVFCDPTRIASVVAIMDDMMVFEPVSPVAAGHLLVAPRDHVPDFTTSPYITAAVMQVAAKVAALKGGDFNLITSAGLSATQSVRHLHIHLVPRVQGDGLKLPWSCDKETLNVNAVR